MYRVSPSVDRLAVALTLGAALATLWVNIWPDSYYDFIEWQFGDWHLPSWISPESANITVAAITANGFMALFLFFIGKEFWEALVLERGPLSGPQRLFPLGCTLGAVGGAVLMWIIVSSLLDMPQEASLATGWQVPIGSDVILGYVIGRRVFGAEHPALHLLLLVALATDFLALVLLGVTQLPQDALRLVWLVLPILACSGVWWSYGRDSSPEAPEREQRKRAMLWPYLLAGAISYLGVLASGLPPCLGLLPVIPAMPHARRSFGVFAEVETFLHDPLNRLAHLMSGPLAFILFLFGLTQGGIDPTAFAPTTLTLLAAVWIGKPLGLLIGAIVVARFARLPLPKRVDGEALLLIAFILPISFTVPALVMTTALPGGEMTEAARLGLALSLLAGPAALGLARLFSR